MFRVVSIFLVLAITVAGYLYLSADSPLKFSDFNPLTQDEKQLTQEQPNQSLDDALESVSAIEPQKSPLKLPILSDEEKKEAKEHVQSITAPEDQPIEIKSADHFVTAEQILQLPELQQPVIVKIETAEQIEAVVIQPSEEDKIKLTVVEQNAKSAATAQSFAVKIPSFKKKFNTQAEPVTAIQSTVEQTVEKVVSVAAPSVSPEIDSSQPIDTQAVAIEQAAKQATLEIKPTSTAQLNTNAPVQSVTTIPAPTIQAMPTVTTLAPKVIIEPVTTSKTVENAPTTDTSILTTLKKNIEEISDIKVADLVNLVSKDQPKEKPVAVITPVAEIVAVTTSASSEPDLSVVNAADANKLISKATSQSGTEPMIAKAPAAVTNQSEKNRIKLRELLSDTESNNKRIFYLHAVNPSDEQGIWGIIQTGLTGTFSKGITLAQADGKIRALIPQDADEILSSKKSSFLGRLLNYKVLTTYVYNYEQGNIGKNPDFIRPGQQLIIVTFTEEELMSVYNHFKNSQRE
ncbi:MAG: hypothetical protein OFPI_03160 [Osedax symbiont Rs2]|nr:MAG: hypothetical protein OFPI_03160 [Osedax symbiont Rs2]